LGKYFKMEINIYLIIAFCFIAIILIIGWINAQQDKEKLASKLEKEKVEREKVKEELNILEKQLNLVKGENAKLEIDVLKFQLQPHTINNLLSKLKVLSNKLNRGIDSLSETLNYVLYTGNKNFVSIEQEIDFIKSYLILNDLFIKEIEGIEFTTSIDESSVYYKSYCLPHLVSAYFIENAFKHGDLNHPKFLQVNIVLKESNFELMVVNKINIASLKKVEKGIGLDNMRRRLDVFLNGKYQINSIIQNNEFHANLKINF
jgi:LytS/YehU family sensor histidine kinase